MKRGVKHMLTIGKYTFVILKKPTPPRLDKKQGKKEMIKQLVGKHNIKINIILFITLLILFSIFCYLVVPQTYGFYHW